jgi:hypothetical protein
MRGFSLCRRFGLRFFLSLGGGVLFCLAILVRPAFGQRDNAPFAPKSKATAKSVRSSSRGKMPKAAKMPLEKDLAPGVRNYTSDNFLLHTDLPEDDAQDLLKRLETMLKLISTYWAKPNARTIEMYVVKDINAWPQGVIPQEGLDHIASGGGVTISRILSRPDHLTGQRSIVAAEAIVYAVADRGTPQHEAVHAYCAQTFGRTGPTWYAEGMAEMGQYWKDKDPSVNCHEMVVEYLKSQSPKELTEITAQGQRTGDSWQNYAWRWALCHLLANNPNYAARFRPLGLAFLTDQKTSFEEVYGPMAQEISFEYLFFLKHFGRGYRADLCGWDWKTKFTSLRDTNSVQAKIDADKGWQASRLSAKEGTKYVFSVTGTWKVTKDGEEIGAAGNAEGCGKLVGILFHDYQLSEPFDLVESGEWTAPQDGKLFLRCQDGWCDLADNKGAVTVKWKLAE